MIGPTMSRLKNDTLLRALLRQPTAYTPIWIMRQAGRYLPEYNQTRARAGSFLELCKSPDLATEVTLQPLARFPLDAAILFSDILTVPDAMGLGLYFAEGEGPRFERPLREEWEIRDLSVPDPDVHLRYVLEAVGQIRRALDNQVPLIGFAGSPFTLACYMIEGRGKTEFIETKRMMYRRPDLLHHILDVNARAVTAYLNAQIDFGAQVVMLFDTWGGTLAHDAYHEFSLRYLEQIMSGLTRSKDGAIVPRIVFTKGGGLWLESMAAIGADAVGLDWTIDIAEARRRVGQRIALQGNLDPAVLFATPAVVKAEARKILERFGAGAGHVFNLGHGVSQLTDPENVAALVDAVHSESRHFHEQ
ncbi:MAG TPA: uroporphyrinogen decarboxylase [Burkholderiales bacterium]|nr:uroporphyrinogen decarboxylase [Burkholderiales bacterium]